MPQSLATVAGLELLDVIELKGLTHYSGCISVHGRGLTGLVYFREGQIVHAEAGSLSGEEAFYAIAQRAGADFALEPDLATSHTIHRSWQFLLMESQRLLDEARRRKRADRPAPRDRRVDLLDQVRKVPGVVWATLERKSGGQARPLRGQAGQAVEEPGAQLGALARVVGERLRTGELSGATVRGADADLLLLATRGYHLLTLVKAGPQASVTEAAVRKLLAARR